MDLLIHPQYSVWSQEGHVVAFLTPSGGRLLEGVNTPIDAEWGILDEWHFNQELLHLLTELQYYTQDSSPLEELLSQLNYI